MLRYGIRFDIFFEFMRSSPVFNQLQSLLYIFGLEPQKGYLQFQNITLKIQLGKHNLSIDTLNMIRLLRFAIVKLLDMYVIDQMSSNYIQQLYFELLYGAARHIWLKSQIHPFYFEKFTPLPIVIDVADNLILVRLMEKIMFQHSLLFSQFVRSFIIAQQCCKIV